MAFCSNVPHRFGTLVFVLKDVLRSKAAIKLAVMDAAWAQASSGSTKAPDMHKYAGGHRTTFWDDGELLLKYCQPIMDAIHLLEADKAQLSQLRSVYKQIEQHFTAIKNAADTPTKVQASRMLSVVKQRLAKHYKPSFDAAFLLDPINFIKMEGEWYPPVSQLNNEERKAAFEVSNLLAQLYFVWGGIAIQLQWTYTSVIT